MQIKMLIVDDDLEVVSILNRTFTTMLKGYLILTATTANSGMSMLKEERPDIVIMDVRLGPESGMNLLQDYTDYLTSQGLQGRTHFIVITAYPDEEVEKEALEKFKVDAFMMKPFEQADIRDAVLISVIKRLESETKMLSLLCRKKRAETDERQSIDQQIKDDFKQGCR